MLFLITNSFAEYTHLLMTYSFGEEFHDLFDAVVVQAMKPSFFKNNEPFLGMMRTTPQHVRTTITCAHHAQQSL